MTPQEIVDRVKRLRSRRDNWASYWQDLAHFCIPRKAYVTTDRVPGQRLDFHRLFDNTAIRALETMAAGFNSHLTNPSSKWFKLATKNKRAMENKDIKIWFKEAEDEVFSTLNTSNFQAVLQEFYLDSGVFGTGAIFTEQDIKTRVRFTAILIRELLIEEDDKGRVNHVYREFEYTAQQAFTRWGELSPQDVKDAISKTPTDPNKKFTFIHAVFPRETRQAGKEDNINMPWVSKWIYKKNASPITESGFNENPYAVGRFNKRTGEEWGFSPAMNVFNDILMLNAEKKVLIRGAMKKVDPAIILPSSGFILPFNLNPAGINYKNPQTPADAFQVIDTKGDIGIGIDMVRLVKEDIEEGFFVPLFKAFSQITKQMTIPEVQRRISENMVLLGPVVGRFTQEVFDPIITRVFLILLRTGVLPPPPEALVGQDLDIQYVSQLALAQRASEVIAIQSFLNEAAAIAQVKPSAIDKINADKAIDILADVRAINPEIVFSDEEVDAIREARAQQAQQQAVMEAMQQGAGIAKDIAKADKDLRE